MSTFALDALSARKGDSLVLRWGEGEASHLALIDGGPSSVYNKAIRPHLLSLAGTDPAGTPLPVILRLVVVSHIDDDHIRGIIDLTNAIDIAKKTADEVPATIIEAWHNAFADMAFVDDFKDLPKLQQAIRDVAARPAALGDVPLATRGVGIAAGAQSVDQGRELDRLLSRLSEVRRNSAFADRGHFVREGADVDVDGLRVTVLAPNTGLLADLKTLWRSELKKALARQIAQGA